MKLYHVHMSRHVRTSVSDPSTVTATTLSVSKPLSRSDGYSPTPAIIRRKLSLSDVRFYVESSCFVRDSIARSC